MHNSAVQAAACIAQPAAFQQACGCARADDGQIDAGWAAAEWAFGLGCAARPRRHVVARCGRGRTGWQCGRLIGQGAKVPWWAVARWLWWGRVCDTGTIHGRWHGSVVAERRLHASLGSGSLVIWFHWLLAPNRFIGSGRHAHGGWSSSRGARLRDLAYGVSKLFSQPCVRLVALRVLWTARAARRPFLFWIGRRARSGCAGPPGPRPLAPPRMRPSESEWDDGGPAGMLGGGARGGGAGQRAERGGSSGRRARGAAVASGRGVVQTGRTD